MKILLVNAHIGLGGGDSTYTMNLANILKKNGHEVAFLGMQNERTIKTYWSRYFIKELNYSNIKSVSNLFRIFHSTLYSFESRNAILKLINDFKPDIAHLNSIYPQISASIIPILKKKGVGIVMTHHAYDYICPNGKFFNWRNMEICNACNPNKFYMAFLKRCKWGSIIRSGLACSSVYLYNILKIYELIDIFINPTEFIMSKYIQYGYREENNIHIPYFVFIDKSKPQYNANGYGLFVGRLVFEKGCSTLLHALKNIGDPPFKIVGRGLEEENLKKMASQLQLKNVKFLNFKHGKELSNLYKNASYVVVPSQWYETPGIVNLEAFLYGKPVIASRIGGIPEIVKDGYNGLLFEAGNVPDLSDKIKYLLKRTNLMIRMGRAGRKDVERHYNENIHYEKVLEVYNKVIN